MVFRCYCLLSYDLVGIIMFMVFPRELISIFSQQENVLNIGSSALRIISTSFIPAGFVLMFIVYCQGVNRGGYSILLTVLRQVILFVPFGLAFPLQGTFFMYGLLFRQLKLLQH